MMKFFFILSIYFYSSLSFGLEIPFSEKSAKAYYSNAETIFLGLKLSEPLSFDKFSTSMKKHLSFDEKKLKELWNIQPKESQYLVIKVYKGTMAREGGIFEVTNADELTLPKLGDLYILFSDTNNFVDWCNAFSVDAIPKNKFDFILNSNTDELIKFLLKNKYHYCLNPPKIRFDK